MRTGETDGGGLATRMPVLVFTIGMALRDLMAAGSCNFIGEEVDGCICEARKVFALEGRAKVGVTC